jgi:hypothetical protein
LPYPVKILFRVGLIDRGLNQIPEPFHRFQALLARGATLKMVLDEGSLLVGDLLVEISFKKFREAGTGFFHFKVSW